MKVFREALHDEDGKESIDDLIRAFMLIEYLLISIVSKICLGTQLEHLVTTHALSKRI